MILYAKYEKSEINKVMTKQRQHLSSDLHEIILTILKRFRDLFGGTLGKWNKKILYLELKDEIKPVC